METRVSAQNINDVMTMTHETHASDLQSDLSYSSSRFSNKFSEGQEMKGSEDQQSDARWSGLSFVVFWLFSGSPGTGIDKHAGNVAYTDELSGTLYCPEWNYGRQILNY